MASEVQNEKEAIFPNDGPMMDKKGFGHNPEESYGVQSEQPGLIPSSYAQHPEHEMKPSPPYPYPDPEARTDLLNNTPKKPEDNKIYGLRRERFWLVVLAAILVLALALGLGVGLGVGLSAGSKNTSSTANAPSTGMSTSMRPTSTTTSSSTASSSSSSTTGSAAPTNQAYSSCPSSDGTTVNFGSLSYVIACDQGLPGIGAYLNYGGRTYQPTFMGCMQSCSVTLDENENPESAVYYIGTTEADPGSCWCVGNGSSTAYDLLFSDPLYDTAVVQLG